jgi:Domain of unknown function (DUF4062)
MSQPIKAVYISSTYLDLKPEREAVREALSLYQ